MQTKEWHFCLGDLCLFNIAIGAVSLPASFVIIQRNGVIKHTLDILAFDEKEGSPRGGALGSPYPSEAELEGPDGVPRSTVVEISLSGDE